MTDGEAAQVEISCPACGGDVPEPVARGNLESYVHHRGKGHRPCRFVVSVDPRGDEHRFTVLEYDDSFEEVLAEMWPEHHRRVVQAAGMALLTSYNDRK